MHPRLLVIFVSNKIEINFFYLSYRLIGEIICKIYTTRIYVKNVCMLHTDPVLIVPYHTNFYLLTIMLLSGFLSSHDKYYITLKNKPLNHNIMSFVSQMSWQFGTATITLYKSFIILWQCQQMCNAIGCITCSTFFQRLFVIKSYTRNLLAGESMLAFSRACALQFSQ